MAHYKMSDVVIEVNERENNPANSKYDRFVGLEHYVSGDVIIRNYGSTERLESTMKVFQAGDILVARRNVYLKRASTVDFGGLTSGDSIVLRAKDPELGRILPFVLNTDAFWDFADQYSDGTMSKRLSPKTLMTFEFDLPDGEELSKLADILWAANDTRESYQALLKHSDELVKSQFIELFKGGRYPIVKAQDVCHFITKGTTPKADEIFAKPFEKCIPYLKVYNLSFDGSMLFFEEPQYIDRTIHESKLARSKVYPNDVLMNIVGPPLGKFALVNNDFPEWNINQAIAIFRAREAVHPQFLLYALMQPDVLGPFLDQAQGVRQLNFSLEQCRNLEFPLPPMNEQLNFVAFVEQLDKSKFELKQAIANTSELMKSLIQQDFIN